MKLQILYAVLNIQIIHFLLILLSLLLYKLQRFIQTIQRLSYWVDLCTYIIQFLFQFEYPAFVFGFLVLLLSQLDLLHFLLHHEFGQSVPLFKHFVFHLLLVVLLFLDQFLEFLVLDHLLGVHRDPFLNQFFVHAHLLVRFLFFFHPALLLLQGLFLQSLQFLDLLLGYLVSLFKVVFQFGH